MATHRSLQANGVPVTALGADVGARMRSLRFGDAVFQGEVIDSAAGRW